MLMNPTVGNPRQITSRGLCHGPDSNTHPCFNIYSSAENNDRRVAGDHELPDQDVVEARRRTDSIQAEHRFRIPTRTYFASNFGGAFHLNFQ